MINAARPRRWLSARLAAAALAFFPLALPAQSVAPLPAGESAAWDKEPVVELTPLRGEIVLNGLWRFMPALGPAANRPDGRWGWIRVPGSWDTRPDWAMFNLDGIIAAGDGGPWSGLKVEASDVNNPARSGRSVRGVDRAWYEREIRVPAAWEGRALVARFERVSTDARVLVDGREAGQLRWPGGELDLSALLVPGRRHTLTLYVAAVPDPGEVEHWMDSEYVIRRPSELDTRGLIGDVVLLSRPRGARISAVFARPLLGERELALDLELAGETLRGPHRVEVLAREWPSGRETKRWTLPVELGDSAPRDLRLPWPDARLWEIGAPALYTLEIALAPRDPRAPALDVFAQRVGLRDIRVDGKNFVLNGAPLRMRPGLLGESTIAGTPALIDAAIRRALAEGCNVLEIWPNDDQRRGRPSYRAQLATHADELGIGLLMPAVAVDSFWRDPTVSEPPADQLAAWREAAAARVRDVRNSPSVLGYVFQGNRFLTYDDQNPMRIGHRDRLAPSAKWEAEVAPARRYIEWLKTLDPTRFVTSHANTNVGDVQTSNNYLGLLPLQEREEWLSEWAASGDMPYMAVEFATPFSGDMNRGRKGWDGGASEQLMTEHAAAQLGARAYALEDDAYRASVSAAYIEGQKYRGRLQGQHPLFLELSAINTRPLWRSWRTWGVSGGMIPWESGYSQRTLLSGREHVRLPWEPGQRGTHLSFTLAEQLDTKGEHVELTVNGEELRRVRAPSLAYLAGPADRWVAKDHHFLSGERVEKTAVLINDGRSALAYSLRIELPDGALAPRLPDTDGILAVGEIRKLPISFTAPSVSDRTDAKLRLHARLGDSEQTDEFALRFHPAPAAAPEVRIALIDPEGDTRALLEARGFRPRTIAPDADLASAIAPEELLVVGRNALVRVGGLAPRLGAHVAAGGRALLFAQDPAWLRDRAGLRVHRWIGRKFWPVATQAGHPILAGLDAEDFRDWRGASSLISPTAEVSLPRDPKVYPTYGWRWGSRGGVSSSAWEKPHRSGWTPLLEGEFDLAYSPLLELRHGAGLVVYCGLDLEKRGDAEPVAAELVSRLVEHVRVAPAGPRRKVVYWGGPAGAEILRAVGVAFDTIASLPASQAGNTLLVLGADAAPAESSLKSWLDAGGHALFLARPTIKLPFNFTGVSDEFSRAESLPDWPEAAGLGLSDLRFRVDRDVPLLRSAPAGGEVGASGLLGRLRVGQGVALLVQLDPTTLGEQERGYLRFTRWRHTRALSQLLANLGAAFPGDTDFFALKTDVFAPLDLVGEWRAREELRLPPAPSPAQASVDPGNEGFKRGWNKRELDEDDWSAIDLPAMLRDGAVVDWEKHTGAVWFRKTVTIPAEWQGKGDLVLHLGPLDDHDTTFFNGARVGGVGKAKADAWNTPRVYKIPAYLVKPGQPNTVAVRLFNQFGGGGFGAPKTRHALRLELATPADSGGLYVPGFRHDRDYGDDPARYVRW